MFLISSVVLFLHDKKMGIDSKKQFVNKMIIGAVVLVVSVVAKFIPFLNEIFGKNRVILANAVLYGSIAVIVYAAAMYLIKKPAKDSTEFSKLMKLVVLAAVLLVSNFIPAINKVYRSVRIPP